jgi:hypothetical protein
MLNRRALIKCLLLSPLVLPNIACALASTVSPKYLVLIELKGGTPSFPIMTTCTTKSAQALHWQKIVF